MDEIEPLRAAGDERNFGYSAAHEAGPLPLLPSGPGGVHGESLHRARSSTHRRSRTILRFETAARSLAHGLGGEKFLGFAASIPKTELPGTHSNRILNPMRPSTNITLRLLRTYPRNACP